MAENAPDPGEPLDVQRIHYLVRLMKRYDLTDLDFSDGQVQIRLRRRGPESVPAPQLTQPPMLSSARTPRIRRARPVGQPRRAEPHRLAPRPIVIESPMVGTYYASSAPDAPAVRLGRFRRSARHHRLHHRGHEGFHRHPGRGLGHDRRDPGQERAARRVRPALVPS